MITARGLGKSFGRSAALKGIDLHVEHGERVAVLGSNGAGKTTLLRILATLTKPTTGALNVAGFDALKQQQHVRAVTGVVAHYTFLYDDLTVLENLRFYGRLYGVKPLESKIAAVLTRVGLASRSSERAGSLSRGQQQRLAIARAILPAPRLLLFDEPDTGLDADGLIMLEDILAGPSGNDGPTVMFSSHNRAWAERIAGRVLMLDGGRLI